MMYNQSIRFLQSFDLSLFEKVQLFSFKFNLELDLIMFKHIDEYFKIKVIYLKGKTVLLGGQLVIGFVRQSIARSLFEF